MSTKKRKPVVAVPRMTTEELVAICERAVAQQVQKLEKAHGIKLPSASVGVRVKESRELRVIRKGKVAP